MPIMLWSIPALPEPWSIPPQARAGTEKPQTRAAVSIKARLAWRQLSFFFSIMSLSLEPWPAPGWSRARSVKLAGSGGLASLPFG